MHFIQDDLSIQIYLPLLGLPPKIKTIFSKIRNVAFNPQNVTKFGMKLDH